MQVSEIPYLSLLYLHCISGVFSAAGFFTHYITLVTLL
jgi:hypothetical protein